MNDSFSSEAMSEWHMEFIQSAAVANSTMAGMGAHDEFSFWNMKICATANDAEL
jgi:hypothetical protein